jgi:hypothetical protein
MHPARLTGRASSHPWRLALHFWRATGVWHAASSTLIVVWNTVRRRMLRHASSRRRAAVVAALALVLAACRPPEIAVTPRATPVGVQRGPWAVALTMMVPASTWGREPPVAVTPVAVMLDGRVRQLPDNGLWMRVNAIQVHGARIRQHGEPHRHGDGLEGVPRRPRHRPRRARHRGTACFRAPSRRAAERSWPHLIRRCGPFGPSFACAQHQACGEPSSRGPRPSSSRQTRPSPSRPAATTAIFLVLGWP